MKGKEKEAAEGDKMVRRNSTKEGIQDVDCSKRESLGFIKINMMPPGTSHPCGKDTMTNSKH